MIGWRRLSVQAKLTAVVMVTCVAALLMAGAGIATYQFTSSKGQLTAHLANLADLIGASTSAAVQFRDREAAVEALRQFRGTGASAARIDLPDGRMFARYGRYPNAIPTPFPGGRFRTIDGYVVISRPILLDDASIGSIVVEGSLAGARAQIRQYIGILAVVLAAACVLAYLLSRALQRTISGPISRLSAVTARVSSERDYSIRAVRESDDELGQLVSRFNEMLEQLGRGHQALREARAQLESRVADRTRTLEVEIAERKRTENELIVAKAAAEASAERYALAAQGANDGLWDWDLATDRLYYSPRWKAIIGYGDDEIGDGIDEWIGRVHTEDLARVRRELDEHLAGRSRHFECEHRIRHKSGMVRWVLTRGLAIRDGEGRPTRMAGSQSDVTDGRVVDALTGLPNRVLLVDRLERMLTRRRKAGMGRLAVLFLDLDGFKLVNDGLGHLFGDQLLQAVAQRLKLCLRATDTLARPHEETLVTPAPEHTLGRLGGDEFVVLLHDVRSVDDATLVAGRIQEALAAPFILDGREAFTSASIGIALEATQHTTGEEMLRDADTAMYRAKALGKGRFEVFDGAMRERVVERMQLDTALRLAVDRHEFVPFFQPIIDLRTGALAGFESLLRWQRPGQGLVLPGAFVGLLQSNGLIVRVGQRFFGDVCQVLQSWQDAHPAAPALSINVNFAAPQFNEVDLLEHLLEMLDGSGLQPSQFVVEITESTAISDFDHAAEVLTRIRDAGFRITLDDFGTGYSSLSCLHELPITGVKLDRSFIAKERGHPTLIKAIVALAVQLDLTVTAEGIETEAQCEQLRDLGCHLGQGYLFGHPADAAATRTILSTDRAWLPEALLAGGPGASSGR